MAGKIWMKVLLIILIIACLFNITSKIVRRNSFKSEMEASAEYIQSLKEDASAKINEIQSNITSNNE